MQDKETRPRIFISYRREDTAGWAGRIADRLVLEFGESRVFLDIDGISPGSDFLYKINQTADRCDVLLAVIGRDWLQARDHDGALRLHNPEDFVRNEISAALRRGIRVIPVLVSGATMPHAHELPADIAALARREAVEITDAGFRYSMAQLIPVLSREGKRRQIQVEPVEPVSPAAVDLPVTDATRPKWASRVKTDLVFLYQEARPVAGWFRAHKIVSALFVLLTVITFSPLWYRPASTISIGAPAVPNQPRVSHSVSTKQPELRRDKLSAAHSSDTPNPVARNFKTLCVVTNPQHPFDDDALVEQLKNSADLAFLNIQIIADPNLADLILEIKYRPSGDLSYEMKSRKAGSVLFVNDVSSDASAATGGEAGEIVKALKAFLARQATNSG